MANILGFLVVFYFSDKVVNGKLIEEKCMDFAKAGLLFEALSTN